VPGPVFGPGRGTVAVRRVSVRRDVPWDSYDGRFRRPSLRLVFRKKTSFPDSEAVRGIAEPFSARCRRRSCPTTAALVGLYGGGSMAVQTCRISRRLDIVITDVADSRSKSDLWLSHRGRRGGQGR